MRGKRRQHTVPMEPETIERLKGAAGDLKCRQGDIVEDALAQWFARLDSGDRVLTESDGRMWWRCTSSDTIPGEDE